MSGLSTLVNNFELILENQQEIMNYPPYRFSHLRFRMMKSSGDSGLDSNSTSIYGSHLGSYLMIWENFYKEWPGSEVIPLRVVGSPLSGRVFQFVGYSRSAKRLTSERPDGFTTGSMLRYLCRFSDMFPQKALAVPIEQVVAELKEGKPMEERESYQLIELREDFCRSVAAVSGIDSGGEDQVTYNLIQDSDYQFVIMVGTVLELTDEDRSLLALSGTVVQVADMMRKAKERLEQLAGSFGFTMHEKQQKDKSIVAVDFIFRLSQYSAALEQATIKQVKAFLSEVKRQRIRF